jgi:cyclophilin family peptidyl-prolyl cis-trans isomerase
VKRILALALLAGLSFNSSAPLKAQDNTKKPVVVMETNYGTIKIELYPNKAPITVKNFLSYVDRKFYDGLVFHRVIPNFMIQGGGFQPGMKEKQTGKPIKNEARTSGLSNVRGTIAMARTPAPDSATAQFFINLKDNKFLDPNDRNPAGYAAFGKVISGMDAVDKIAGVKTGDRGPHEKVPTEDVVIKSIRRAK